jgi:hypothetical protein
MVAYAYFAIRDPDRLQSEPHRIQVLQIQQQSRPALAIDVTPVPNPALPPAVGAVGNEGVIDVEPNQ